MRFTQKKNAYQGLAGTNFKESGTDCQVELVLVCVDSG